VFVVHGRDDQVRESMFDFLRALDLRPLEWESLVASTGTAAPFLGNVLETALARAQAVVVLLTPDDMVQLHPALHEKHESDFETRSSLQPRPNVLIELGMALVAHPNSTIIVEIGAIRPVADLDGRNVIRFDGSAAAIGKLIERLKSAGCTVDDTGADWRRLNRFAGIAALSRQPPP
jgi:predicted nucleotide-binding protein